ncbi:MAG: hypothetical protein K8S20_17215 [Chloroflexi bacterium]|nr:hypothetical protein [Chloroflexota bacterium]
MPDTAPVTIKLNPKRILVLLMMIIAMLVCLSIWGQYLKYFPGAYDIHGPLHEFVLDLLMHSFYTDTEASVPTFFNTLLLFLPGLLFAVIGAWKSSINDKFKYQWMGLSLIFLYLSMDEAAVLHEKLIPPMRSLFNFEGYGGLFYFAWIIPGIAVILLFAIAYLRFFLHLENRYKLLFFFSLAIYVSGIIGGEMLSGHFAETIGLKNFTYAAYTSAEESLEWTGCSLTLYSLLLYIQQYLPEGFTVRS